MEKKNNGELVFLNTSLEQNNEKISAFVYRKPRHTGQYLDYISYHKTSCNIGDVSSLVNRAYSIITNKSDWNGENTRIEEILKENGF